MPLARATAIIAALAALPLATSCAKRITEVDASYATLEGLVSPACKLYTFRDEVLTVEIRNNGNTPDVTSDDVTISTEERYAVGPGAVRGQLLDRTQPSEFILFGRDVHSGWQRVHDYSLHPARRLTAGQLDIVNFTLPAERFQGAAEFQARGVISGSSGAGSTLSNVSEIAAPSGSRAPGIEIFGERAPSDSLFTFNWTYIALAPGTVGYWIHVYQNKPSSTRDERIAGKGAAPLASSAGVRDILVAYVPETVTTYTMNSGVGEVLHRVTPLYGQTYYVRVTAVSADGRVTATCRSDLVSETLGGPDYLRYAPGAILISPTRLVR